MINTICRYFFWFMLYSVAGWVMETLLFLIRDRKAVKRGFLFGPVCPIYGCAAVISTALIYDRIHNIFLVFLAGFFLCGILEYATHFILEKLFHAMWWDYSGRKFNIKGRVYLNGLVVFGAGVVLIVKVLQPLVIKLTDMMPPVLLYSLCFALYSLILVDAAMTVTDLAGTIKLLKNFQATLIGGTQKSVDLTEEQFEAMAEKVKGSESWNKMVTVFTDNALLRRIRTRYPNFTLKKYKFILDLIINNPQEDKERKDIKLYGTADSVPTYEPLDEASPTDNEQN